MPQRPVRLAERKLNDIMPSEGTTYLLKKGLECMGFQFCLSGNFWWCSLTLFPKPIGLTGQGR